VERRTETLLAMPPGDALGHWHILRDRLQQLHWEVLTHMQTLQQLNAPGRGPQGPAGATGAHAGTAAAQGTGAGAASKGYWKTGCRQRNQEALVWPLRTWQQRPLSGQGLLFLGLPQKSPVLLELLRLIVPNKNWRCGGDALLQRIAVRIPARIFRATTLCGSGIHSQGKDSVGPCTCPICPLPCDGSPLPCQKNSFTGLL